MQAEYDSFDAYVWRFVNGAPRVNRWQLMRDVPATTAESDALSKDLIKRGDVSANVEMKPGDVLIIPQSWF